MINNEIKEKFKKLYYEKFKITLSNEEVTEMAADLVNLVKILLKSESKSNNFITQQEERRQNEIIRAQQLQ